MPQLGRVASWMTTRCDRKACNGMKGQMASCVEILLFFCASNPCYFPLCWELEWLGALAGPLRSLSLEQVPEMRLMLHPPARLSPAGEA